MNLQDLAKVELHCHLDGSLSLSAIRQLADLAGIAVPKDDEALRALVSAPAGAKTLMEYLQPFDWVRPLLQTKEALALAAYDVAKQAHEDGAIYQELRFAPELSMDQGLTAYETVDAVLSGLEKAEAELGITARLLVCGMRQAAPEISRSIFQSVAPLAQRGLVGFDFAGNEVDFPPEVLKETMASVEALGLPFTLHAGECHCAQNVQTAIQQGARRIGHGTALYNRPDIVEEVVAQQVTVEICLTSNLQTKACQTLAEFPYPLLKEKGARISINTDNRTVSQTNLTKEYKHYQEAFGLTLADFYAHNQEALSGAFVSDKTKKRLRKALDQAYLPLLGESSSNLS
ncbi:adenosine deaminase [Streptococcus sp. DD12]|uniref:adenosine deaminase n=1 Tax=Streptococcus sp. DD12 TaxID=1777880 RepID=UPI000798EE7F|nr:adenosine deaminase [Streptococcus sp. DD12]KXT76583.1 Adenosine deaminase [Streptococcus sp. DD12]